MSKAVIFLLIVICGATLYNFDALTGRWKFDNLCETEGGPKFLGVVEPNKGWLVEPGNLATFESPFAFEKVDFVRFTDESGRKFDVRSDGYIGSNERKYIRSEVDASKLPRYALSIQIQGFHNDERFKRTLYTVTDLVTADVLATYTSFSYSWTKPERTLLAAPTVKVCWSDGPAYKTFSKNLYLREAKK